VNSCKSGYAAFVYAMPKRDLFLQYKNYTSTINSVISFLSLYLYWIIAGYHEKERR